MKNHLLAGVAGVALIAGAAQADGDLKFTPGEGVFTWDSFNTFAAANDFSGQELVMFGPWTGPDAVLLESVLSYFEAATGASVNYSGSDSFEQDIVISVRAGSAPNIAAFPQPGLASDMAGQGFLSPLPAGTTEWLEENYGAGASWAALGTYLGKDGTPAQYAFPYKADLKSLVWYSESAFDEAGYDIPETMEELKELTQQIVDDGGTPWCIGLGSGAATGWPATDWVEDLMLRTQTPEDYDAWVTNDLKFDDPKAIEAIEEFGWFFSEDDFVDGGAQAVSTTDFRDSPKGLFTIPLKCYMHRQASFIPSFFPEENDGKFFYFPSYEGKDLGKPVLGAGTMFAITNPSDLANAFIAFLETPIAHEVWMAQSGFLTPFLSANTEAYASEDLRGMGEILLGADTFRFDASDLMPGEIGAGAFWTGMVDYTTGTPAADVGAAIQKRWDSLN